MTYFPRREYLELLVEYLDKFAPEVLIILIGLLIITTTLFLWLWFDNKKKLNKLHHQVPVTVVKNYLDSIIQNSSSLKSALIRGETDVAQVAASVIPAGQLQGDQNNLAMLSGDESEIKKELSKKLNEIAKLQQGITESNTSRDSFEAEVLKLREELVEAHKRIKELEAMLKDQGGDPAKVSASNEELESIAKERDELKEKLKEYEVIEDDLANLKRLQQENKQLKQTLESLQGDADVNIEDALEDVLAEQAQSGSSEQEEEKKGDIGDDALKEAENFLDQFAEGLEEGDSDASTSEAPVSAEDLAQSDDKEAIVASEDISEEANEEAVAAAQDLAQEDEAPKAEELLATPDDDQEVSQAKEETTEEAPKAAKEPEKTPEDLLSEFEKMLS